MGYNRYGVNDKIKVFIRKDETMQKNGFIKFDNFWEYHRQVGYVDLLIIYRIYFNGDLEIELTDIAQLGVLSLSGFYRQSTKFGNSIETQIMDDLKEFNKHKLISLKDLGKYDKVFVS